MYGEDKTRTSKNFNQIAKAVSIVTNVGNVGPLGGAGGGIGGKFPNHRFLILLFFLPLKKKFTSALQP